MTKRKINTGNQVWHYLVGRKNVVIIPPNKKKCVINFSKILNLPWDSIERSIWKGSTLHAITPSVVKNYIEKHLV